jgi:hypothetical protein
MALPEGFSQWEHLQDVLRNYHNKLVRAEFSDVTDDDQLAIPRGALKLACLLNDQDTCDMTILRLFLFFFHARKAADLQAPVYGIPIADYDAEITYRPHVTLHFSEDPDQFVPERQPVRAMISFRLMHETSQSMTEAKARVLAQKIKTEFGQTYGYRWRKGKIIVTYRDRSKGYELKLFAFNETEAREVINKVLDLQGHTLDNEFLRINESRADFPVNPGTHIVYGKSRQKPRKRPTTYVRFIKATLTMWGMPKGQILVDLTHYGEGLVAA